MTSSFAPIISFVPLALLAVVAWRSLDPAPGAARVASGPVRLAAAEEADGPVSPAPAAVNLAGYDTLDMDTVFVKPAGPKGLEYTAATEGLRGRKVRISGWMVKHLHDDPRIFLLHSRPMVLLMSEYGLADDLPPSAVHVILPDRPGWAPPWTPAPLEVCGVLELGPREERDGRISHLRLVAEHVVDRGTQRPVDLCKPIGLQPGRLKSSFLAGAVPESVPPSTISPSRPSTNPTK
jgi:hypothetical protein